MNGTFDGMIGLVQKEEAVTQSVPTVETMNVLDYIAKAVKIKFAFSITMSFDTAIVFLSNQTPEMLKMLVGLIFWCLVK